MSIRTKLIATFGLIIALIISLGVFVLIQLAQISGETSRLAGQALPGLTQATLIKEALISYRGEQIALLAAGDPAARAARAASLATLESHVTELLAQYAELDLDERQGRSLANLSQSWETFVASYGAATLAQAAPAAVADLSGSYDLLQLAVARLSQSSQSVATDIVVKTTESYDAVRSITIAVTAIIVMFSAVVGFSQAFDIADGLRDLKRATGDIAAGNLDCEIGVVSEDELGALAGDFRSLMNSLREEQAAVARQQQALSERNAAIEQAYAELQASVREREALSDIVRALSTPVLPVHQGVLVIPLVGVIDTARARQFRETVLEAVEERQARRVIIDVTGLPILDEAVARLILQTAQATRLLGARTTLAGIRPELAQTLVGLGVSLQGIEASADLQSAMRAATTA